MPLQARTKDDQLDANSFEDELRSAVQGVRGALAEVVAGINVDATKPQQMARDVGLDKSLSWKLSRILSEDDASASAVHLPGKAGLRIVLKSFEKAGASEQSLDALRGAVAAFDRMVEIHCGDRDTLEMMIGHLRRDGNGHAQDEVQRKKAFQGNSSIWGVQARVQIVSQAIAPNADDPDFIDFATVSGLVDLRRLRSNVPWAVASVRQFSGDGKPWPKIKFDPIDESVAPAEVPLLRDYSSPNLPPLRIAPGLPGSTRYEITDGAIGNTGTITCITGWISRHVAPRHHTPDDTFGEHLAFINTPTELLVFDLLIHRGLEFNAPEIFLYSQLPGGPLYPQGGREVGLLPLRESIIDLGSGPPDPVLPELPRYHSLADLAMRRLSGSPNDYVGYRLRLRYPPIPTIAVFRHVLPEPRKK